MSHWFRKGSDNSRKSNKWMRCKRLPNNCVDLYFYSQRSSFAVHCLCSSQRLRAKSWPVVDAQPNKTWAKGSCETTRSFWRRMKRMIPRWRASCRQSQWCWARGGSLRAWPHLRRASLASGDRQATLKMLPDAWHLIHWSRRINWSQERDRFSSHATRATNSCNRDARYWPAY